MNNIGIIGLGYVGSALQNALFNKVNLFTLDINKDSNCNNLKELSEKIRQGCSTVFFSKLFIVDYNKKAPYLGIIKFNYLKRISKKIIPLGGIKIRNLNQLNNIFSEGFALLSEVKKKPAKIFSRLF